MRMHQVWSFIRVGAVAGVFAGIAFADQVQEFGFRTAGCPIKGNISDAGRRIYHAPGQRYYDATAVNWLRGERWFCSEAAAREAGWRKARI